jgi:hypothetical protein
MLNIMFRAGTVGAGTTLRYGSGSNKMMRLLAPPAPQHWKKTKKFSVSQDKDVIFRWFNK